MPCQRRCTLYIPLATLTQMGITMNARSLEQLVRRLASTPLAEATELKGKIIDAVKQLPHR